MLVHVGSTNPVKIQAVTMAFNKLYSAEPTKIVGKSTASGVTSQPMTDLETITGATNRALSVLQNAHFGIGIEGGLQKIGESWFGCGWVVIVNAQKEKALASSARMQLSDVFMKHIEAGLELGEVNDLLFGTTASKSAAGHFGLLTQGHVTRSEAYTQAVIFALSHFASPQNP
jgi:inosine/xanthosine triphosphatase